MAKKKAKKKRTAPGVDPNERRRERLEARRQEKARALAAQRRAERRERIIRIVVLTILGAAALWFFFLRGVTTPEAIAGHPIETFSDAGVNDHREGDLTYDEIPPVSGQHAPSAAACGIHGEQIPDEQYVHSLEHGAVAVFYDPQQVDEQTITGIEDLAGSYDGETISAPYEGMDQPIYVTSWGERMALGSLDEEAVREYIDTFRGKGPEPGSECPNTSDDSFDTSALTPDATPSPTATGEGGGTNDGEQGDGAKGDNRNDGKGGGRDGKGDD